MKYNLSVVKQDNTTDTLVYDTEENTLFSINQNEYIQYPEEAIAKKQCKKKGIQIRLSMGKQCNYKCKYCHQSKDIYVQKKMPNLVDELIRATERNINGIQFWGGEPFLFFDVMKDITKEVREKLSDKDIHIGTCTNGSFLKNKEIQDWIINNDISFTISYDGRGQFLRGEDPLTPEVIEFLHRLKEKDPEFIPHFNPVISKEMHDPLAYSNNLKERVGMDVYIGEVRPIMIIDEATLSCALDEKYLQEYFVHLYKCLSSHQLDNWYTTNLTVKRIIENMGKKDECVIPCFVNKLDTLTVDLEGNVLSCQSFNVGDKDDYGTDHKLQHITEIVHYKDRKFMDLSQLEMYRKSHCKDCLVRTACRGGCPFTPRKYTDINCKYLYWHNLAIFLFAIQCMINDTGIVTSIERQ